MVFHHWSDKDVDWEGINNAAHYIQSYCSKWGRISGHSKEKFGTVRYYAGFGGLSLHSLIYPLYVYSKFPKWLWNLDVDYISPVLQFFFREAFCCLAKIYL